MTFPTGYHTYGLTLRPASLAQDKRAHGPTGKPNTKHQTQNTMKTDFHRILKKCTVEASAPCRVDVGGTLDIGTFYLPLQQHEPLTFNIALDLRTRVRLLPHRAGYVRISSAGVGESEFRTDEAPFTHPLGLMFAVAAYFGAEGVAIEIESASPPRSALGGSSVAAVGLIGALAKAAEVDGHPPMSKDLIVRVAHALESAVAQVPCGLQDQLAAAFGGIHAWHWIGESESPGFHGETLFSDEKCKAFGSHLIVAYCGVTHESKNINSTWVRQFLSGETRRAWMDILDNTKEFIDALREGDFDRAVTTLNLETAIRCQMTPQVLDDMGRDLVSSATDTGCGAKFAGAGGGGCIWAMGEPSNIESLKKIWNGILSERTDARILDVGVDSEGLLCKVTEQ